MNQFLQETVSPKRVFELVHKQKWKLFPQLLNCVKQIKTV